jgi:hypothetical protein
VRRAERRGATTLPDIRNSRSPAYAEFSERARVYAPHTTEDAIALGEENSKQTRVEPAFTWLRDNAEPDWPTRVVELVDGLKVELRPGPLVRLDFEKERPISPSPARLAWMIRNAERLTPRAGVRWREYKRRVTDNPRTQETLVKLDDEDAHGIDRLLRVADQKAQRP